MKKAFFKLRLAELFKRIDLCSFVRAQTHLIAPGEHARFPPVLSVPASQDMDAYHTRRIAIEVQHMNERRGSATSSVSEESVAHGWGYAPSPTIFYHSPRSSISSDTSPVGPPPEPFAGAPFPPPSPPRDAKVVAPKPVVVSSYDQFPAPLLIALFGSYQRPGPPAPSISPFAQPLYSRSAPPMSGPLPAVAPRLQHYCYPPTPYTPPHYAYPSAVGPKQEPVAPTHANPQTDVEAVAQVRM